MKLAERFNKLLFNRVARGVLDTPALPAGDREFMAVSMVQHRDVIPYLLAIKSFAAHARPARVLVVADPSLDAADRAVMRAHVPHIEIREAQEFRRPALPVGGCWERLSAIASLNAQSSIVQVDADTITSGELREVVDAALANASFILRSERQIEIVSADQAAVFGRKLAMDSHHIQAAVEARLDELPNAENRRYARGCAGFTGFGKGALTPELLDEVSIAMRSLHGNRWSEWGSEQVTSNLLAASAAGAFLLPYPRYCNADGWESKTVLAHFIGYCRYVNRTYESLARATIRALS